MTTELRAFNSVLADRAPGRRLMSLVADAGRHVMAWDARYRERCRLADLSDEVLRDIGVSRGEAAAESKKPVSRA